MNESFKESGNGHSVVIRDRKSVLLTGIEDVVSFDETAVVLSAVAGTLAIEGEGLHILQMNVDSKEFCIEGKICALSYLDKRPRGRGLLRNKK